MASDPEPPSINPYAPPPFDHPKADLILRSDDGVDFRVSTFILAISSEFFANMFNDGRPDQDERRDNCPVVRVQEHSRTLQSLLTLIYPIDPPVLDDIEYIQACLAAALKYDMKSVVNLMKTALRSMAPEAPFCVWAVAVRYGLEVEAQAAAAVLVRQNISLLDEPPLAQDILRSGPSAGHYFRLLKYQRLAGEVGQGFTLCGPDAPPIPVGLQSSPAASDNLRIPSQSYTRIQSLADVIIRSADGREFPAHRAFLSLASPVLAALLLVPSVRDDTGGTSVTAVALPVMDGVAVGGDSLPVVSLEEDAATLAIVLSLCYPYSEGDVIAPNLQILPGVTSALTKYEMDGMKKVLQDQWKKLSASDPLHAYVVATRYRADVEARQAARMLLDRKLEDYYSSILEVTSVATYRDLVKYERACREALQQQVQAYFSRNLSGPPFTGGGSEPDTDRYTAGSLPVKSNSCRSYYSHMRSKGRSSCTGVSNLLSPSGACEPCLELADTIAGVLRRLEAEPDALMTLLESRNAISMSQNLLCSQCSRQGDFTELMELYDELYTRAESIIYNVRPSSTYTGHHSTDVLPIDRRTRNIVSLPSRSTCAHGDYMVTYHRS